MKASNFVKVAATVAALSLPMAAFAAVCPGPDTFGHTCTDNPTTPAPPGACVDIATTGDVPNMFDDACTVRTIGFSGNFYGTSFTQVGVASNGFLMIGGCGVGSTDFSNDCPVPNALTPNGAIFGAWDDLNPGNVAGRVRDGQSGVAPNRVYTAEWNNVPYFSGGGTTTFEVQIHENGGGTNESIVRIRHGIIGQTTHTVGIENATASDGLSRFCNTAAVNNLCHQYHRPATTPPPGGTCDLAPVLAALAVIEGKLDTNAARVTALQAAVAALTAAVNNLSGMTCDIIRLENTPHGQREACSPAVFASCGETYSWNSESTGGPQPDPPVCP